MAAPEPLTDAEKEQFLTHGWLRLKNCFTREQAAAATSNVWTRLGMDPADKTTWTRERTNMPHHAEFDAKVFAPRAWAAIEELCGGRIMPWTQQWRDTFIVNHGTPEGDGKDVHPRDLKGWHVDGDFFVHYLDSPEQALLVIPLFTDIAPRAGGTVICPEAIPKVAQYLHDNPEGVSPIMQPRDHPDFPRVPFRDSTETPSGKGWFNEVARSCENFVEATGDAGDIYLLHPLMLHTASNNTLRHVRIITNPPIGIKEPFCFDRADGAYSLVEKATLRALGKEDLKGWGIKGAREAVVPDRIKVQEEMKRKELERLRAREGAAAS